MTIHEFAASNISICHYAHIVCVLTLLVLVLALSFTVAITAIQKYVCRSSYRNLPNQFCFFIGSVIVARAVKLT